MTNKKGLVVIIILLVALSGLLVISKIRKGNCNKWWAKDSQWVKKIDDDSFKNEVLNADSLAMVVFCGGAYDFCCNITAIFEDIAKENHYKLSFYKKIINSEKDNKYLGKNCPGIPEIVLFDSGKAIKLWDKRLLFLLPIEKPIIDDWYNKGKILEYFKNHLGTD
ncbi:hypothetical protein ACFL0Y_00235 [Patescibacteria group bacterium]